MKFIIDSPSIEKDIKRLPLLAFLKKINDSSLDEKATFVGLIILINTHRSDAHLFHFVPCLYF